MNVSFNWKVIAGLAVAALMLYVVAPQFVIAALPLFIVALCPLAMLLMHGMGNHGAQAAPSADGTGTYTCPMHPEVQASVPGQCPKCGMSLVAVARPRPLVGPSEGESGTSPTREEQLRRLQSEVQILSARQAALAEELGELQVGEETRSSKAVKQAEQVARDAESQR